MRTTKRFTPAVMRRWERNKRSEGTYSEYQPWHQITRDDPPSHGQSRIKSSAISARQHSFLSKIEFHAYCCLTLMANVKDVREQYRLSPLTNTHEQCAYGALDCNVYEGTIDVARRLGFKHPTLFSKGEHEPWRMTTDFLCLVSDNNKSHLLAISVKPSLRELDERDKQLLKIEREYWRIRNVEWQLLTESCFSKSVRLGLSFLQAWALHEYSKVDPEFKTAV